MADPWAGFIDESAGTATMGGDDPWAGFIAEPAPAAFDFSSLGSSVGDIARLSPRAIMPSASEPFDFDRVATGVRDTMREQGGQDPEAFRRNIQSVAESTRESRDAIGNSWPSRIADNIGSAAADAIVNPLLQIEGALGFETADDMLANRQMRRDASSIDMAGRNWITRTVNGTAEGLAKYGTLAATGGGVTAVLGGFMADAYESSKRQALKEGKTEDEALKIARANAAVEGGIAAAMNMVGLGGLEAGLKKGALDGLRKFGIQLGAELTEEQLTTLAQNLASQGNVGGGQDYVDTAAQTILTMGVVGGVQNAQNFVNRPSRSTAKAAGLDGLVTTSKERQALADKVLEAIRSGPDATQQQPGQDVDAEAMWTPDNALGEQVATEPEVEWQPPVEPDLTGQPAPSVASSTPRKPDPDLDRIQSIVNRAIPKGGAVASAAEDGNGYVLSFPGGERVQLTLADSVEATDAQIARGLADYGMPDTPANREAFRKGLRGKYHLKTKSGESHNGLSLIQMRSSLSDEQAPRTLWHELVHFGRDSGMIPDAEWQALVDQHAPGIEGDIAQQERVIKALQRDPTFKDRIREWIDAIIEAIGIKPNQRRKIERALRSGELLNRQRAEAMPEAGRERVMESQRAIAEMHRRGEIDDATLEQFVGMDEQEQSKTYQDAKEMADAENEHLMNVLDEYDSAVGRFTSAATRLNERRGGDASKQRGFDLRVEALRSGQYPSLAAEAERLGGGDIENGLRQLAMGGRPALESQLRKPSEFIDTVLGRDREPAYPVGWDDVEGEDAGGVGDEIEAAFAVDPTLFEKDDPDAPARNSIAAKNASTGAARGRMDLPPIKQPAPMPDREAEAEAIRRGIPKRAMKIADALIKGDRDQLNQVETKGLAIHLKDLEGEYSQLKSDLGNEALPADERVEKEARLMEVWQDVDILTRATKIAGTEWGRAGVARQRAVLEDFSPIAVDIRARKAKGADLTPAEQSKIDAAVKEAEDAQAALEGMEAKEDGVRAKKRTGMKSALDRLRKKVANAKLPTDLTKYARDLAKKFILEGVDGRRALIDKVQLEVRKIFPEALRPQIIEAISGYGEFKELSKDEASKRLRDLKGQLQQISKLKDMAGGKAPKKTGMERREPSDTERDLIKEVNEAKKAGGYEVTDPAKQLKTALATIKKRLTNQIADLTKQVESRTKIIKQRKDSPSDAEVVRLTAERDALKAQFEEIFGKPGMTEEQRIAAAEKAARKQIADYERRLAAGDFSPAPKRHNDPLPKNLANLRVRGAELRQRYRDANPNPPWLIKAKERLATLEAHLAAGTLPAKVPAKEARSPAARALRAEIAATRKAIAQSEPAQLDRLQKALGRAMAKLESGQFALPEGRPAPLSPEIERAQYELGKARREVTKRVMALRPKTVWGRVSAPFSASRTLLTGMLDLMPLFRQGAILSYRNPAGAVKALDAGFRALRSDFNARSILAKIDESPMAPLRKRAGLYLADMDGATSQRQEEFQGTWIDNVPVLKQLKAANERNFTVFMNKLRADSFDSMVRAIAPDGNISMTDAKAVATAINIASGRGGGGNGTLDKALSGLAPIFFSPRYTASRFQYLVMQPVFTNGRNTSARAKRVLATELYAKPMIAVGIVYALAMAAGAELEEDGKLKVGDTRVDLLSGMAQTYGVTMQTAEGLGDTAYEWGTGTKARRTWSDEQAIARFLRKKFAPIPAAAENARTGKSVIGEKVTPMGTLKDLTVPLSLRNIKESIEEQGVPGGVALWLTSLFGAGVDTYD